TLIAWTSGVAVLNRLGGDYLLVLSMGSTLCLIFSPLSEAIGQALTTLVAYFQGAKKWSYINLSLKAAFFVLLLEFLFLSLPFYFCKERMLDLFLGGKLSPESRSILSLSCYWLWIFFLIEGWGFIGISLLTGLEKTFYLLKMYLIIWPTIFLPIYCGFYLWGFSPDKLWMLSWISCLAGGALCFYEGHLTLKKHYPALSSKHHI
ncbi:MAG: hypothetical protein HYZ47_03030, partial [Simkania negevensis]|nr:hypothetical protein [Simkania negevensis]